MNTENASRRIHRETYDGKFENVMYAAGAHVVESIEELACINRLHKYLAWLMNNIEI